MKFIKQLSEDEFIVKMGDEDLLPRRRVIVAHDYVSFVGRDWHCTDLQGIKGPYGSGNVVNNYATVQIPIRMAQDMLRTVLKRNYLQPEHLKSDDGTPRYLENGTRSTEYVYWDDNHTQMIAIQDKDTG